jgi:type IV pilus assembly protein PilB
VLRDHWQPPLSIRDKLVSRIKVLAKLDISEKRVPQDGRMRLVLSPTKTIDFRVSTLPTLFGEKTVMRILDATQAQMGIDALGYDPDQKALLIDAITRPYGMVLVTGPTGSGKTVSLYSCLNVLNKPGINISTAEDPAEINLPGVNQVNVNDRAGLTFPVALKVLPAPGSGHHHGRRDPRPGNRRHRHQGRPDRPHGVLDPAHERRAVDADAPDEHGRGAVQHRLLGDPDHGPAPGAPPVHLQAAARDRARRAAGGRLPRRRPGRRAGSPTARSAASAASARGYKGRVGIYQIMPISPAIEALILANGNAMEIAAQAESEGVSSLRRSGLMKVKQG